MQSTRVFTLMRLTTTSFKYHINSNELTLVASNYTHINIIK